MTHKHLQIRIRIKDEFVKKKVIKYSIQENIHCSSVLLAGESIEGSIVGIISMNMANHIDNDNCENPYTEGV